MKSTILILAIISFIWIGNTESAWHCPGCCAVGIDLDGNQLCLCNPDCKCKCSLETGCVCPRDINNNMLCKCPNIATKPTRKTTKKLQN